MKLEIWYSVRSGGDGSAYPFFFESEALAQLDQDWQSRYGEGWGEDCIGSIEIESESNMTVLNKDLITKESLIKDLQDRRAKDWIDEDEYEEKMKDLEKI